MRDTLVIDDAFWPTGDLNQLTEAADIPWPNWLEYSTYQPLVAVNLTAEYHRGEIQFLPGLAANWTKSPDGKTYTFNLREGVTFSNGDPFNAFQVWMVMYGSYYVSGNATGWLESYNLFDMSNVNFGPATVTQITAGGLIHPSQDGLSIMMNPSWPIHVTTPNQIVFQLRSPFSYFPGTLVIFGGLIYDAQWVLGHGGFGTPSSINTYFNLNPIPGTGPYVVTDVAANSFVKFVQNPTYWGRDLTPAQVSANPTLDPGHVKHIILNYKPDDLSRYIDVSTGSAQISAIEASDWNLVLANPDKFAYLTLPPWSGLLTGMAMNTQVYPTNITAVRQAIVHAINYADIAQKVFFGKISPIVGPEYPAWKDFYNLGNLSPYSYNLILAKEYLAEAHLNHTMPALTYTVWASCQSCLAAAVIVQQNLADLNITVNIVAQSQSNYLSVYTSYSKEKANPATIAPLSTMGGNDWAGLALTPVDFWNSLVSNESLFGNWAIYSHPTVQAAIAGFTETTNVTLQQVLARKAEIQIYNDAPYAWFGNNQLWELDGSLVWQKGVICSFANDPTFTGADTAPLLNTVTFCTSNS